MAQALLSPQEGATAVGADDLATLLREMAVDLHRHLTTDDVRALEEAAARIEALQRQVADCERRKAELIAGLDSYHGRLRTLGDALERAREALRLARPFVRDAGSDEDPDAARGAREAEDAIEALQRVEEWKDACQAYSNTVTRLNERAETAESSLRTLGDALERAREECAVAAEGAKLPDGYRWDHDAMEQFDFGKKRAAAAIRALTPPTRDTSCEAIAKEPATKWDVRKSPCPTCGHHIRTVERVPFQYDDEPAASDKGADE